MVFPVNVKAAFFWAVAGPTILLVTDTVWVFIPVSGSYSVAAVGEGRPMVPAFTAAVTKCTESAGNEGFSRHVPYPR